MKLYWIGITLLFIGAQLNAQDSAELSATVIEEVPLPGIPSASGIESKDDNYYICGDDSPWLFEIDEKSYEIKRKILIHSDSFEGVDRIPAEVKPDYESMVDYKWGSKDLLIFGSGSGPNRKTMMRVDFTDRGYNVDAYTLENLYNLIMDQGEITPEQLNIEGVVSWRDHIVLLNRETNHLILITKYAFERYMKYDPEKQKKKKIDIDFYQFELPEIDGQQARFSGGMKAKDEHTLVFTASVERRSNAFNDGEILGSFVGLIALNKLTKREMQVTQVMKDGKPYGGKVEAVFVDEVEDDKLLLRSVTDDDSGGSKLLQIELKR